MHILRHLFVFILAGLMMPALKAQERIQDDPNTTIGKLENGLTYYLRHNTENKGCADFYIIHNVGALQEEDNQNGLAHFLEHMAFNGTERYPDKTILNFLEKDGVRFGYNVNAYTSRTETVYNISAVPQARESFVDSVLFILHDWSCAISCEENALNAERGVISEEWRRKDEPRVIMADLQNNLIYGGSKHTKRNVLGTLDIINGFKRQEILDFYHKWYRPDLQAIAIVGDIDVEDMEARVKKIFSEIPAQENPAQKEEYLIPALKEPLFEHILHPMIKVNTIKIVHKQPFPAKEERATLSFYKDMALRQIATEILKERFNRETAKEGCPAKHVALVTSKLSSDFYTSVFTISPKSYDHQEESLRLYAKEVKRLLDHGFSADELESAKFQASKRVNNNSQENVKNGDWIKSCLEHFLRGEALISPVQKKEYQSMMISEASSEDVYAYIRSMFGDCEKIFSYTAERGKEDLLPGYDRMKEILAEVEGTAVDPRYPEFKKVNLDVAAGNAYTTRVDKLPDEETLANGVRIRRLKSEPVRAADHVAVKAVFNTGLKAMPQDKISSARVACAYIDRNFGFRNYSRKELRDSPQTGNISTMLEIGRDEAVITLHCGKEEAGKAFQLLYLLLTEPYFDTNKNLERFKTTQIKSLEKERSSKSLFDEEDRNIRYNNHPWRAELTAEDVKAVDMAMVKDVFARAFGDPGLMTLYICDDLTDEEISGLYKLVGSLPENGKTQMAEQLPSWPLYKGRHSHVSESPLKTVPKSEVSLSYKCDIKVRNEEYVIFDILDYIMSARCMNKIREERGGTYSVTFISEFFPRGKVVESSIAFQTRPEIRDILIQDAEDLMAEMAADGPTKEEFENARKYLAKHHVELQGRFKNNLPRKLSDFMAKERYGIDKQTDYLRILEKTSRKDIRKMARKLEKGDMLLSAYTEN